MFQVIHLFIFVAYNVGSLYLFADGNGLLRADVEGAIRRKKEITK